METAGERIRRLVLVDATGKLPTNMRQAMRTTQTGWVVRFEGMINERWHWSLREQQSPSRMTLTLSILRGAA
jgi:hypothetical protein